MKRSLGEECAMKSVQKNSKIVILKCKKTTPKRFENAKNAPILFMLHKNRAKKSLIFYITKIEKKLDFLLQYGGKCGILNGSDVR